ASINLFNWFGHCTTNENLQLTRFGIADDEQQESCDRQGSSAFERGRPQLLELEGSHGVNMTHSEKNGHEECCAAPMGLSSVAFVPHGSRRGLRLYRSLRELSAA